MQEDQRGREHIEDQRIRERVRMSGLTWMGLAVSCPECGVADLDVEIVASTFPTEGEEVDITCPARHQILWHPLAYPQIVRALIAADGDIGQAAATIGDWWPHSPSGDYDSLQDAFDPCVPPQACRLHALVIVHGHAIACGLALSALRRGSASDLRGPAPARASA
jgi:hypothetical protein